MTFRRIWEILKEACTPHWDDTDAADITMMGASNMAPTVAAPIQAANEAEKDLEAKNGRL